MAAGQVQARIDSHSKVLYARLTNTRAATFERALRTGARPHAPVALSEESSPVCLSKMRSEGFAY